MTTKRCPGCTVEKPLTQEFFYFRGSGSRSGKACGYCKECFRKQAHESSQRKRALRCDPVAEERKKFFKQCAHCKKEFPRTAEFWHFRPGRKANSGRIPYGYCKPCNGVRASKWKRDNRAQYRAWGREDKRKLRAEVITAYGGKCVCCGESHPEFLDMDHINGGGRAHIKQLQSQGSFYVWIKRNGFPKDLLRLLCANCNQSRGRYGYCPHERDRIALAS